MQSDIWKCYNWFQGRAEDRILNWRRYRETLDTDHLDTVAKDWAAAPVIHNYLDPENFTQWPTAWELISEGKFCDVGCALGMYYTLFYSNYPQRNTMKLEYYRDRKNHRLLNLLNCEQGKYMLNYSLGEIVNNRYIASSELVYSIDHSYLKITRNQHERW